MNWHLLAGFEVLCTATSMHMHAAESRLVQSQRALSIHQPAKPQRSY
jgi:hypothetical protein